MYSTYYYYVSCEAAGVCLESACSIVTVICSSVIVIDRGKIRDLSRGVRVRSRGIDHGDGGGDDVVEARIGNVKDEEARGIAGHKGAGLDIVVVVEGVGGIAFAAIALGEGSIAVEAVEVVVDCSLVEEEGSLEGEREDIQVVEASDLDCTVQLGSGSDFVVVGMEVLADCGLEGEEEIQVDEACDQDCTVQLGSDSDSLLAGIEEEE
jgi:hypothetical protein